MLLSILGFVAVALTVAMFLSKEPMLGFAGVIFWSLFGAQCINLAVYDWDVYFTTGFGALLGMNILCGAGAFQFYRGTKKGRSNDNTDFIDEEDRSQYTGETKKEAQQAERGDADDTMSDMPDDNIERRSAPSARTQALRDRAKRRKTGLGRKPWWKQ